MGSDTGHARFCSLAVTVLLPFGSSVRWVRRAGCGSSGHREPPPARMPHDGGAQLNPHATVFGVQRRRPFNDVDP